MTRSHARAALVMAAAALACIPEEGPLMAPGEDCLGCHDGDDAKRWTVAGTWPPQGAAVTLTDAAGKTLTLRTNKVGNFYTAEAFTFPITASVNGARMPAAVTYGGCNRCHGEGGGGGDR